MYEIEESGNDPDASQSVSRPSLPSGLFTAADRPRELRTHHLTEHDRVWRWFGVMLTLGALSLTISVAAVVIAVLL